jgi:hypothetical protein
VSLFSAAEIADMRATSAESRQGTAVILREVRVSDGGGGGTVSWVPSGTVSCRVAPIASAGEGEHVEGERLQPDSEVVFSFPADTDVDHNCRIEYGDETFSATAVRGPFSVELDRRVEAKELE